MQNVDLDSVCSLMQVQNSQINKINKVVYVILSDLNIINNSDFHEFTDHFWAFLQHQAICYGFCRAIETVQVYTYVLFEKLLSTEILTTAEQLELAISHLELVTCNAALKINPYIILLSQGITLLEETQLQIIEQLEALLEKFQHNQLQN